MTHVNDAPFFIVSHPFCASYSTLFKPKRWFLNSSFPLGYEFPYFVFLRRIRRLELFSGESVNFVQVLFELILETYFPILLREKFVQESLKKKKIILSSKIILWFEKIYQAHRNFGKFIHVRGNLLEDYSRNPIFISLRNVIRSRVRSEKTSNRVTKLDSSYEMNIRRDDMREYGFPRYQC